MRGERRRVAGGGPDPTSLRQLRRALARLPKRRRRARVDGSIFRLVVLRRGESEPPPSPSPLSVLQPRPSLSQGNKNAIAIAHNSAKYDSFFALQYLLDRGRGVKRHCISGNKIVSLTAGANDVTFKDSCQFIPARLADLPKMFDFADEAAKGWFPHGFAARHRLNEKLPSLPDVRYYYHQRMRAEERDQFFAWHREHRDEPFDFMAEAVRYCLNDVLVLAKAVRRFVDEMHLITGIDPIYAATTIAGLAKMTFQTMKKPEHDLGIVPASK